MASLLLVVAAHLMMDLFQYLSLKILKRSNNNEMVVVVVKLCIPPLMRRLPDCSSCFVSVFGCTALGGNGIVMHKWWTPSSRGILYRIF